MTRRASSLSALLTIGALALLWCCAPCCAVGQKNWTPDGPISVSAGAGNELENGKGYACNSKVECVVQASDQDYWTDPRTGQSGYESDTLTYQWTCTVGSFWKETGTTPHATWMAPNSPQTGVVIKVRVDDSNLPGRDDPYVELTWTITVYKIRCLVVCGTYDENIYWPEDGYNGDELWRANGARFRSHGTIEEIWHHEHVADIFQPVTQHYKLEFALDRYPECETADTPTTTVSILGNDVPFTGWEGYAWVNTRTCMGRGHYAVNLTFRVDGRQVNGIQRIPQDVTREFYEYAIYDSPSCPSQEFTWQHLADACLLVGCKSTETEIADAVYGGVNGHISTGCICAESFQYIWLGAITDPVEGVPHRDGMCCCRAKGMSEVMQVLGVPEYTTIVYVNERPEPNAERLAPDGTCTVCGLVYRAYWAGFWNNWLGACRSHGEKSIAYAPSGPYKGNYYQIYTDLAQDFGFVWVRDDTNEECTHGLPAPPPPPDP